MAEAALTGTALTEAALAEPAKPHAGGGAFEARTLRLLDEAIARSKGQADRPMVLFITLRLGLITASAVLPALAAHGSPYLSFVAILVTILTGLDTHFHWGDEWRHFRRTQLGLQRLRRDFEFRRYALANGRTVGAVTNGVENLETLHNAVENLLLSESDAFFKFRITEWSGAGQSGGQGQVQAEHDDDAKG